uniref:Uncharacterized protein n=1 Tax=Caenorhabditis tropicalis TaxID=1561998 RepID=A0A1I7UCJ5_9PELO
MNWNRFDTRKVLFIAYIQFQNITGQKYSDDVADEHVVVMITQQKKERIERKSKKEGTEREDENGTIGREEKAKCSEMHAKY